MDSYHKKLCFTISVTLQKKTCHRIINVVKYYCLHTFLRISSQQGNTTVLHVIISSQKAATLLFVIKQTCVIIRNFSVTSKSSVLTVILQN